jgi:hypothetical protein
MHLAQALVSDLGPLRAARMMAPVPGPGRAWSVVTPASDEREDQQWHQ